MSKQIWTTMDGNIIPFNELTQQHISNILWFFEIFHNATRYNSKVMFEMGLLLHKNYDGKRLDWKPLPVEREIQTLIDMKMITRNGDIIIKEFKITKVIGTITHIPDWFKLIK